MDFSHMNWALFASGVSGVLILLWLMQAFRHHFGPLAVIVSLAHLVVASLTSAAPVRGYVDSDYAGFNFGYLHAGRGIETTVVAGAVFLAAVISAFIAIRNRRGPAMWFVALTSAFFAINLGRPWLQNALIDMSKNEIQFGEYLTIPGDIATALLFAVLIVPFLLGVWWGARQARRAAQATPS